jgi:hypothetical protein
MFLQPSLLLESESAPGCSCSFNLLFLLNLKPRLVDMFLLSSDPLESKARPVVKLLLQLLLLLMLHVN